MRAQSPLLGCALTLAAACGSGGDASRPDNSTGPGGSAGTTGGAAGASATPPIGDEGGSGTNVIVPGADASTGAGGAGGAPAVDAGRATEASAGSKGMTVQGAKLLKDGAPFLPRGFNMIGLLTPDGCPQPPGAGTNARKAFGATELQLARDTWHANTLRFQISQRGVDPTDPIYVKSYVDRVVAGVTLARSLGFIVIVSMQDQSIGCGSAHPMPFDATLRGWSTVVPLFAGDPYVMFELFNEPVTLETDAGWVQWQSGGATPVADNLGETAIGEQDIVAHIRQLGAHNVLIADGANHAGKLQNLYPNHLLTDTLATSQIAYAVHPYYFHLSDNSSLATDQANWDMRFGYLTAHVPLVATEWNASASCFAGQAARVLDFFAYFDQHDIGILAHGFDVPGTMVKDLSTFAPTELTACDAPDSDAGKLLQDHFLALATAGR